MIVEQCPPARLRPPVMALVDLTKRGEIYYEVKLNTATLRVRVGRGYPLVCSLGGENGSDRGLSPTRLVVQGAFEMWERGKYKTHG